MQWHPALTRTPLRPQLKSASSEVCGDAASGEGRGGGSECRMRMEAMLLMCVAAAGPPVGGPGALVFLLHVLRARMDA